MRWALAPVTVATVATDHAAATPPRGGRREWLASVALATGTALVTALGPFSHARGQGLLFAFVLFSPIMLLRRWPLPAVITVQAGVGRRLAGRDPQQATAALASIETIGRTAQDELHAVLGLLPVLSTIRYNRLCGSRGRDSRELAAASSGGRWDISGGTGLQGGRRAERGQRL